MIFGTVDHGPHLVRPADIAGIEAQAVGAGLGGPDGQAVVEMNIGDEGYRDGGFDGLDGRGGRLVGHGHPDDFTAGRFQPLNL